LVTNIPRPLGDFGFTQLGYQLPNLFPDPGFGTCVRRHVHKTIEVVQTVGQLGFFTILLTAGMPWDVAALTFEFKAPVVRGSIFDDNLGLLERERDEHAEAIANFVTNFVASKNADRDSLVCSRKS
jgi:hypothetical protein